MSEIVKSRIEDGIGVLTFAEVDRRNVLSPALVERALAVHREFVEAGVVAAVIEAEGEAFCSGRDPLVVRKPDVPPAGAIFIDQIENSPLAWVAATLPGAAAIGIAGIGVAPAVVALFLYSLLPVVANTVAGLDGVPADAEEAARGMGMTRRQRLLQVELPLAFPVILTGIRIVLVQNIGLATVAALIGGGGFGVFVFQGVGQTAMDLVLLGAVPTVALAFAAGAILDAVVEMVSYRGQAA